MLRPIYAVLFLLLLSCKSSELTEPQSLAAAPPVFLPKESDFAPVPPDPVKEIRCKEDDAPICPEDRSLPYRCIAYRYDGKLLDNNEQIASWGDNPCEAKRALHLAACDKKLDPDLLDSVSCSPDANQLRCPRPIKNCSGTAKPMRCYAQFYRDQLLDSADRPQAWGKNECEARQNLEITACRSGLDQEEFGRIVCENEPTPALCPPQLKACMKAEEFPSQCTLLKVGGSPLKSPLKSIGTSLCEARYRLELLACRQGTAANQLTPEDLGSMACIGLDESVTLPGLTN